MRAIDRRLTVRAVPDDDVIDALADEDVPRPRRASTTVDMIQFNSIRLAPTRATFPRRRRPVRESDDARAETFPRPLAPRSRATADERAIDVSTRAPSSRATATRARARTSRTATESRALRPRSTLEER